jgi:hypothetical protein
VRVSPALRLRPTALWTAFALVHAVLIALCLLAPGWPLGDVDRVYRSWAEGAASGAYVVGITTPFVYPILAFVPIFAALTMGPALYSTVWLGIVTALNALAFGMLVGPGRAGRSFGAGRAAGAGRGAGAGRDGRDGRHLLAAWWWLGFLLLLGPIALARIDSVTAPLVIIALLQLAARPIWATVLLTIATWVKVWPAAVIAALLVAARRRWQVVAVAAGTSAAIVAFALLAAAILGGNVRNVFSFITQQTSRGLQIESPVSLLWLWQAAFGVPGSSIYYDRELLTYQVAGPGTPVAIDLMTPLLALGVAAVLLLGVLALQRGAAFERLFPPLVLALVVTLIAVNKVGSPQFIGWLAAPVIFGLVTAGKATAGKATAGKTATAPPAWRTPAVMVLVLAALTQVVYPYLYDWLLVANPLMLAALTARNLLEFVLLALAIHGIWTAHTPAPQKE